MSIPHKTHTPGFLALVWDAKSRIKQVNIDEYRHMPREDVVLIDVREDNEWAAGHAAGAIHLGKGIIERDIETEIPDKSTTLVLYCGGGYRSGAGGGRPSKDGIHQRYFPRRRVAGLGRGWSARGKAVERPSRATTSARLTS